MTNGTNDDNNLRSEGGTTGLPTPMDHDRKCTQGLLTTSFNNDDVDYSDNERQQQLQPIMTPLN